MIVDDAWEHKTARSVDDLVKNSRGFQIPDNSISLNNLSDFLILNDQRAIECPAFVDKRSPFYQRRHFCGRLSDGSCVESASDGCGAGCVAGA